MLFSLLIILATLNAVDTTETMNNVVELDPIIVVGQREPVRLSKTVNSAIQISPEKIRNATENNILNYLNNSNASISLSSVTGVGYGLGTKGQGKLLIRGLGFAPNRGALVLIDGRPDIAGLFGHPLPDTYRKAGLASAELVKGGASTLYGSNAIAGVLDLHSFYRPDLDRYTNLEISGGSYNTYNTVIQHSQKFDKAIVAGWHEYIESDNHRDHSDYLNRSGGLRVQFNEIRKFNLFVAGRYTSFDFNDPGPIYAPEPSRGDILRTGITFGADRKDDDWSLSMRLYNSYGEHAFSDGFRSVDRNNGLDIFSRLNSFISDKISLSGGVSFNQLGGFASSPDVLPFPPNPPVVKTDHYAENEYAIHTQTEIKLNEKINLTLGGRFIDHERYNGHFVYQTGLVYVADNLGSFKLSAGSAYRNPTISELVLFPAGNEELKPEEGRFYELGYFKQFGTNFSLESAVFYREGENLILSVPNTSPPPMTINKNSGKYYHNGFEGTIRYANRNSQATVSFLHLNQDNYNLSVPDDKVVLTAQHRFDRLTLNLESTAAFNTTSDSLGTIIILDDYLVVNSSARYELNQQIILNLSIGNLFDADYQVVDGYPMPGRTFRAGLAYRIF